MIRTTMRTSLTLIGALAGAVASAGFAAEKAELFTVLAYDQARGLIDIQYADGRVERIDEKGWESLNAEEVESPEEWHPSMDDFAGGRRPKPR